MTTITTTEDAIRDLAFRVHDLAYLPDYESRTPMTGDELTVDIVEHDLVLHYQWRSTRISEDEPEWRLSFRARLWATRPGSDDVLAEKEFGGDLDPAPWVDAVIAEATR